MNKFVTGLLTLAMYAASLPVIAMITPAQAATKKHWRPREPWYVGQAQALSRRTQGRSARASPEASIARCGLLQLMRILIENGAPAAGNAARMGA